MSVFQFLKKSFTRKIANTAEDRNHPHAPDFRKAPHYKGNLDEALEYLADVVGRSDDYLVRVLDVAGRDAACVFVKTICDQKRVEETLRSLHQHKFPKKQPKNLAQYIIEKVVSNSDALFMTNLFEICEAIVTGDLVLLVDGVSPAIVLGAKFVEHRAPEQPNIESASRGSQVSFVETMDVNVGLLRRAVKSETLAVKKLRIGYRSRTEVAVMFMEDVANPGLVDAVLKRLNAIHMDIVSQSAAVEQLIIDHHWTPFPMTRTTQRIDSTARVLNQGKVIIMVEGDPTALLLPASIIDFFQTEEDYSHSPYEATFVRWLRIVAFVLACFLPALYIAFVDFNPELLPKLLGLQIARSREGVPFPAVLEVVIMQVVIEILREATLRMPKQMGQTLGIVGGLVVGEASVQAGLVSNILIIVVALTAISVFVTPSYEFAMVIRLISWIMIIGATTFGLYGMILITILVLYHLASLKSFGISYMDPLSGEHMKDVFMDGLVRAPVWMMDKRSPHLHPQDDTGSSDYENPVPHLQLELQDKRTRRISRRGRRKP